MKKAILACVTIMFLGGLFAGCNGVKREDVGLVGGGVAGGVIGSAVTGKSTAGTIAGTVGGAYLGRHIAKKTK